MTSGRVPDGPIPNGVCVRHSKHRHLEQEEVLTAAVGVAFDLGLHAVTTANVAARLAVPERSIGSAWPDGDELVATTFSRIVAAELAEVKREVLANPSPVQQLSVLLDTLAEPVRVDVDSVWLESWSLGRRNPALGDAVRAEEGAWHAFVAAVVRRGVKSGDWFDVDPDEVAAHLLAVIDGVNAYSLVGYHTDLDRLRLLHAVARTHLGAQFDPASVPVSTA
ncbi:TetR family transcriptional regulator [Amnibacterium kyonggiense]|uniref:TetR family transcriptional regulator n=1 Tax=Amnibacterium kyonggiense TaxID=595671 RepID=A0A4V6Q113_9MICO|nr:TetR family transcriptional regulator [Amnibacterium kyonggiense]